VAGELPSRRESKSLEMVSLQKKTYLSNLVERGVKLGIERPCSTLPPEKKRGEEGKRGSVGTRSTKMASLISTIERERKKSQQLQLLASLSHTTTKGKEGGGGWAERVQSLIFICEKENSVSDGCSDRTSSDVWGEGKGGNRRLMIAPREKSRLWH